MTPMQVLQGLAAVAAVVVAVGPAVSAAAKSWLAGRQVVPRPSPAVPKPAAPPAGPSYQQAMLDLSSVRLRLVRTDGLTDATKQSIDTLTLALVAGSDR